MPHGERSAAQPKRGNRDPRGHRAGTEDRTPAAERQSQESDTATKDRKRTGCERAAADEATEASQERKANAEKPSGEVGRC